MILCRSESDLHCRQFRGIRANKRSEPTKYRKDKKKQYERGDADKHGNLLSHSADPRTQSDGRCFPSVTPDLNLDIIPDLSDDPVRVPSEIRSIENHLGFRSIPSSSSSFCRIFSFPGRSHLSIDRCALSLPTDRFKPPLFFPRQSHEHVILQVRAFRTQFGLETTLF